MYFEVEKFALPKKEIPQSRAADLFLCFALPLIYSPTSGIQTVSEPILPMPKLKSKAKAKNLGAFAVKQKGAETQQSDEDQPRKRLRDTSPDPGSADDSSESSDAEPTGASYLSRVGAMPPNPTAKTSPKLMSMKKMTYPIPRITQIWSNG
ncbi:hypothetical protein B0H14DRAFT_2581926 [Mycena olivaceomarginata]|nr:hypothetical protein B0H14DRAFT_2581926 [Mycena olivaceomarginata]